MLSVCVCVTRALKTTGGPDQPLPLMSSLGFNNNNAIDVIENERRAARAGGQLTSDEDIAVYNWGAEDYDGLGNAFSFIPAW